MTFDTTSRFVLFSLLLAYLSAGIFFMIDQWHQDEPNQIHMLQISKLNREIVDLEQSLIELELILQKKNIEIGMKDVLLEEKNIQLTFMIDQVHKLKKQQMGVGEGLIVAFASGK